MNNNKLPQNYVELFSLYPKIKEALEEYEYDEAISIETNWEGDLNNPETLDRALGQVEDEDEHWLDPLIQIVGGEPDYYDIGNHYVSPRDRLAVALYVLKDGDSGLEFMTYSNTDLEKCLSEIEKSLSHFGIPKEAMVTVDIGDMMWNREVDQGLGSGWAGNIARKF